MAALVLVLTTSAGVEPPATGAATVVPANVLAYVHVSTDSKRSAVRDALAVGPRFPTYPLIAVGVISRLTALIGGGAPVQWDRDIRPWLGREMALALLNTATSNAGSEMVVAVARPAAARAFVMRAGAMADGSYRTTTLYRYRSGATLAFIRHYLVLGQDASVTAAIDAAAGAMPTLASSGDYRSAASGEPADRVLDAYVSSDGVQRLLMPRGGLFAALGTLLAQPALTGAALSLSASGDTAKLYVHSAFARAEPAPGFAPSLDRLLPAGTLLELDVAGARGAAPRVLGAAAQIGIAAQAGPLLRRLGAALAAEGVNIGRVESLFSGETSVAVAPGGALIVLTRVKDTQAASDELANLEVPVTQLFPAPSSGSGQIAQFSEREIDGVTAHELSLGTGVRLDYALFHGLLVISTSLDGIGAVAKHVGSLTTEAGYRTAVSNRPRRVTSLLFLDFSKLLDLAERTEVLRGARFRALSPDIRRISAAGLYSTRGEADSTAELTFEIK